MGRRRRRGGGRIDIPYDLNGNIASHTEGGATTTFTYGAENELRSRSATGSFFFYRYDAYGMPVGRVQNVGGSYSDTLYVDGLYEWTHNGAYVVIGSRKYYQAFGRNIVMREVPAAGGAGTLYYPLADHLGGTVEVLNSSGATVSETKYWPYGATRTGGIAQTDKLFTGQRQEPGDSALGLYNYKARFYSTTLGRMVSPDSLTSDGLNRFAYVRNNPMRYIDPTGNECGNPNEPTILWNPCDPTGVCDANCQGLIAIGIACQTNPSSYICSGQTSPPPAAGCDANCQGALWFIFCTANRGAPGCGGSPAPPPVATPEPVIPVGAPLPEVCDCPGIPLPPGGPSGDPTPCLACFVADAVVSGTTTAASAVNGVLHNQCAQGVVAVGALLILTGVAVSSGYGTFVLIYGASGSAITAVGAGGVVAVGFGGGRVPQAARLATSGTQDIYHGCF